MNIDERNGTERPQKAVFDSNSSYRNGPLVTKGDLYKMMGFFRKKAKQEREQEAKRREQEARQRRQEATQRISNALWKLFWVAVVVIQLLELIDILGS